VFPERSFGVTASADAVGLTDRQLDWFDRWLRPEQVEVAAGAPTVTWFRMGADEWCTGDAWPPRRAHTAVRHLAPAGEAGPWGVLAADPPPSGTTALPVDPDAPVPTIGGPTFLPGMEVAANAGPREQRSLVGRPDVAAFVEAAGAAAVREVAGPASVVLHVQPADVGAPVCARLVDVGPDGSAVVLTEAAGRVTADPADPAGDGRVAIDLGSTAHRLGPGHRFGVLVTATSVPRYDRPASPRLVTSCSRSPSSASRSPRRSPSSAWCSSSSDPRQKAPANTRH
jgi:hypothetical protein